MSAPHNSKATGEGARATRPTSLKEKHADAEAFYGFRVSQRPALFSQGQVIE